MAKLPTGAQRNSSHLAPVPSGWGFSFKAKGADDRCDQGGEAGREVRVGRKITFPLNEQFSTRTLN
jgi:hypothetical protein